MSLVARGRYDADFSTCDTVLWLTCQYLKMVGKQITLVIVSDQPDIVHGGWHFCVVLPKCSWCQRSEWLLGDGEQCAGEGRRCHGVSDHWWSAGSPVCVREETRSVRWLTAHNSSISSWGGLGATSVIVGGAASVMRSKNWASSSREES